LRRLFHERASILDEPIAKILTDMNVYGPDSPEYPKLVMHLERLVRLKAEEARRRVSPDTVLIVSGNLLGILIIVAYEQKHVMVSKGLGFILRTNQPNV
jgi:hypothetical protein